MLISISDKSRKTFHFRPSADNKTRVRTCTYIRRLFSDLFAPVICADIYYWMGRSGRRGFLILRPLSRNWNKKSLIYGRRTFGTPDSIRPFCVCVDEMTDEPFESECRFLRKLRWKASRYVVLGVVPDLRRLVAVTSGYRLQTLSATPLSCHFTFYDRTCRSIIDCLLAIVRDFSDEQMYCDTLKSFRTRNFYVTRV